MLVSVRSTRGAAVALSMLVAWATAAPASEWYVGPKGTPGGSGTPASPWDVESALLGKRGVRPWDTIYLLGGTYRRRPDACLGLRNARACECNACLCQRNERLCQHDACIGHA